MQAAAALALFVMGMSAASAGQTGQAGPQVKKLVAVKAARLIDGLGGAPVSNAVVLIENDRITAVGAGLSIPSVRRSSISAPPRFFLVSSIVTPTSPVSPATTSTKTSSNAAPSTRL